MGEPRTTARPDVDWGLFVLVVVASQGFSAFLPGDQTRSTLILATVVLIGLVVRQLAQALSATWLSPLVLFLAFWLVGAALLSPRPMASLPQVVVLILMVVYTTTRQGTTKDTIHTFALATTFALVPSIIGLVTPILAPVFAHAGSAGGYAGYFSWNSMSGMCAAAALLSIVLAFFYCGFWWWQVPGAAGAVLILVLSDSATADGAVLAAFAVLGCVAILRRVSLRNRRQAVIGVGIIAVLLVIKAVSDPEILPKISEALGRTDTVSNRTYIWNYAMDGIAEAPYWGYGFGFWGSYTKNSAHNGFLDLALTAGLPAVGALVVMILAAVGRLAVAASPMLPLLAFGIMINLALSQLAIPSVASLAILLAVGAAAGFGARTTARADAPPGDASTPAPTAAMRSLSGTA
ncbi:O-antigen ligase [Mycobacterium sp. shizuoka-1]|uniref:O-antigen ligase family protein n=1 Tax=Mycobacterium sp. shizuoka-1 TaxID=2039281 RepID=UPI000C065CFD|nr:O-antigen ligase family protein [Mycobacterium sp. shizuoka-1]GAY16504.1 hypothetical protein MSZK_32300 [Mycobacterium sp. shizuoka-1]